MQQFRGQQPDAGQVSRDLISEELSHPYSMLCSRMDRFGGGLGGLRFHRGLRARAVAIEFFFEGHTFRSRAGRSEY